VDAELERHTLATLHRVPRPAGLHSIGEPLLGWKGRSVASSVVHRWPNAQVVVNGGNCVWPGVNWVHYVHHAWRAPSYEGPYWYRMKSAAFDTWARRRERAALRRARLVITNSQLTSRHVIDHLHVEEKRVHTVYLGSDAQWGPATPAERKAARLQFDIPDARPVAVFVGALGLDHRKGFDVLFEAWRRLCDAPDWDVDLFVAGEGKALGMWRDKIGAAGLTQRIRMLGFSHQVKHLLAAADLLVSPVRYEAYGLNVQEAICRGVPALLSTSAGAAEQYSPDLAPLLLPDPEDVSDLVGRLLNWRAGIDYWREQFRPLGQRLRRNTWQKMAENMVTLIQQVSQGVREGAGKTC